MSKLSTTPEAPVQVRRLLEQYIPVRAGVRQHAQALSVPLAQGQGHGTAGEMLPDLGDQAPKHFIGVKFVRSAPQEEIVDAHGPGILAAVEDLPWPHPVAGVVRRGPLVAERAVVGADAAQVDESPQVYPGAKPRPPLPVRQMSGLGRQRPG